ncbi:hypothetical protein FKM82_030023 [Ascaphus truei]
MPKCGHCSAPVCMSAVQVLPLTLSATCSSTETPPCAHIYKHCSATDCLCDLERHRDPSLCPHIQALLCH